MTTFVGGTIHLLLFFFLVWTLGGVLWPPSPPFFLGLFLVQRYFWIQIDHPKMLSHLGVETAPAACPQRGGFNFAHVASCTIQILEIFILLLNKDCKFYKLHFLHDFVLLLGRYNRIVPIIGSQRILHHLFLPFLVCLHNKFHIFGITLFPNLQKSRFFFEFFLCGVKCDNMYPSQSCKIKKSTFKSSPI